MYVFMALQPLIVLRFVGTQIVQYHVNRLVCFAFIEFPFDLSTGYSQGGKQGDRSIADIFMAISADRPTIRQPQPSLFPAERLYRRLFIYT